MNDFELLQHKGNLKRYQLKIVLENAERVILVTDNHVDAAKDLQIFIDYLKSFCADVKIQIAEIDDSFVFQTRDAIFCCFFDSNLYREFLKAAVDIGVNPLQIFSPGLFFSHVLREKKVL